MNIFLLIITILAVCGAIIEFISLKQSGLIAFAYGFMITVLILFWYCEVNNVSLEKPIICINQDMGVGE